VCIQIRGNKQKYTLNSNSNLRCKDIQTYFLENAEKGNIGATVYRIIRQSINDNEFKHIQHKLLRYIQEIKKTL